MPDDSGLRAEDLVFRAGRSTRRAGDDDGPPAVTRLAAYGVIVRDGRMLLSRVAPGNLGEGLWTLPGGGLDFGEAPDAGALREVEEETGLQAEIRGAPVVHSDTGIWQRRAGSVRYHHVRFVYPMAVVGGEERLEVDGSTDAFEWVPLEAVRELPLGDLVTRVLEAGPEAGREA
ncbi:MAG TPA: NUDIX domain-containing protein [Candidatus Limnocylindrales bacterium]|nr:NUDIX domain-containing protein [Candidatus Limnocylindrales bacterium]